jgi:hypothetical protein
MGDLNADPDKLDKIINSNSNKKLEDKYKIILSLRSLGMFDSQTGINQGYNKTWKGPLIDNKQSESRIDHIWITRNLIQDRVGVNTISDELFSTDHALVTLSLTTKNLIHSIRNNKKFKQKRKIFDYANMNNQNWQEYREFIDQLIVSKRIKERFLDNNNRQFTWLNDLWEEIKSILMLAKKLKGKTKTIIRAEKSIFDEKINNKDYRNIFQCLRWRKMIKENNFHDVDAENIKKIELLYKDKKTAHCNSYLKPIDLSVDQQTIISGFNQLIHRIRTKLNIEVLIKQTEQINDAIEQRCKNFANNKKTMLNSLLEKEKRSIIIDKIVSKDINCQEILITEETEVKNLVAKHFENITNYEIFESLDLEKEWEQYYVPRSDIDPDIYIQLMDDISEEEWDLTLKQLKQGKAPGISEISYDLIKKAGNKMNNIFRVLINETFKQQRIPKEWKKVQIYPIPKPEDWGGDINKTRPITLLECPRKLMFKILCNRLSKILSEHSFILGNNNYAALPGKSTLEPIHTLNLIMEDARKNKKELWIMFQDMLKAYDR